MNGVTFFLIPAALYGLLAGVVVFFTVWKFYRMLSSINENLAGIRRAIERFPPPPPAA